MEPTTVYIAVGVLVLLVAILFYLRWNASSSDVKEHIEDDEEPLPDDSDVDVVDEGEEFTIIDNE
jgi:hypothetical protein